ncbi:dihydroxyacetone kinase [Cordyceps militaris CM01]|uniref:Dihydroxyacetone kinase n=1 Tax=Cordyceps militaris (strain CM01) TaxID=983644 RepID=G3J9G3_CORMM|nr:dihydroxyacetone kinase [Cordyceps militaris CM01]EGX94940.1 dihydroxyacetone kinase [Cordyceps militaris CM01]
MSSRHFINDATDLVHSALHSLTLTNPHVALDAEHKIVYRRPSPHAAPQVALLAGGGSGHEPSFAGMVGPGMLTAAVAGTVFASPSAEQVRQALMTRVGAAGGRGVLVVVMNYTGDVLNFGMAVEQARAGVAIEMVVVGDDVGVGRARGGKVGRRGIAGTVLVLKIAGALAARGAPLADVARVARLAADNTVSVGASLAHVHVPGRAVVDEDGLARGEVEIGMGIHNEAGCEKARLALPALVTKMLAQLLDGTDADRAFLTVNSNEVVLLVNNLGGVSPLEMGAITSEVVAQLRDAHRIRPVRVISGTFMTSLNGMGFSISLLNVVNTGVAGGAAAAPNMVELLDAPSEVTGWSAPVQRTTWEAAAGRAEEPAVVKRQEGEAKPSGLTYDTVAAKEALTAALKRVIAAEPDVTRYDTVVGDGDCGIGMKRGAEAVLKHLETRPLSGDLVVDVAGIVRVVESTMDGTSGALYAIFLNALVHGLRARAPGAASLGLWAAALRQSCDALARYTPARPGDRTLVDALYPFVETLAAGGDVAQAARAAREAAEATKGMKASLGRSVYVGGSGYEEVPDPGAWGLACLFEGLAGI